MGEKDLYNIIEKNPRAALVYMRDKMRVTNKLVKQVERDIKQQTVYCIGWCLISCGHSLLTIYVRLKWELDASSLFVMFLLSVTMFMPLGLSYAFIRLYRETRVDLFNVLSASKDVMLKIVYSDNVRKFTADPDYADDEIETN